jgi:hypothetical protein
VAALSRAGASPVLRVWQGPPAKEPSGASTWTRTGSLGRSSIGRACTRATASSASRATAGRQSLLSPEELPRCPSGRWELGPLCPASRALACAHAAPPRCSGRARIEAASWRRLGRPPPRGPCCRATDSKPAATSLHAQPSRRLGVSAGTGRLAQVSVPPRPRPPVTVLLAAAAAAVVAAARHRLALRSGSASGRAALRLLQYHPFHSWTVTADR